MAYTTTTLSGNATLVGTSGADQTTSSVAAGKSINVNAYDGLDTLTISNGVTGGTIGMGGKVDTVTLSETASKLNITLGAGADTFTDTASKATSKITVGGQGGADTFNLLGASATSYYGGGQGKDKFRGSSSDGGTIGANTTLVGGSEADTFGLSTDGLIVGASAFINGQVDADKIYVIANATATVRGGSEADTIKVTSGSSASYLYGDKGADTVSGGSAADTIDGGGGADSITGNAGLDVMTGGLGKDVFNMANVVASTAIAVDNIKDFTIADDKIGAYSADNLETYEVSSATILTVLSEAGNGAQITTGNLGAAVTKVSGAYNLGTSGTGSVLALSSSTAFSTSTLVTALETSGSLELTAGADFSAKDGFIVFYDDNVDTYAALVTTSATWSDNATSTDLAVTNLTKLSGLADASTITSSNMLAFTA